MTHPFSQESQAQYDADIANQCAARAICSQFRQMCASTCVAYNELTAQIRMSAIPARYLNIAGAPASTKTAADLIRADNAGVADFVQAWGGDLFDHVSAGRGLFLHGRTGNGKTTIATALALSYIRARVSKAMAERQSVRGQAVYFVDCYEFLETAKAIYERDNTVSESASAKIARISHEAQNADLVIFDDFGAGKMSATVVDRIVRIINYRLSAQKSSIFTSNLSLDDVQREFRVFDEAGRTRSRIEGATTALCFVGADKRRKGTGA